MLAVFKATGTCFVDPSVHAISLLKGIMYILLLSKASAGGGGGGGGGGGRLSKEKQEVFINELLTRQFYYDNYSRCMSNTFKQKRTERNKNRA